MIVMLLRTGVLTLQCETENPGVTCGLLLLSALPAGSDTLEEQGRSLEGTAASNTI